MSELTLYGYKKCGTCKKAEKWLGEQGVDYTFVDITTDPPKRTVLKQAIAGERYEVKHLYNTSGKAYREGGWTEKRKTLSEAKQLDALAKNGRLIKRPIVTDGESFTIGFKADVFAAVWGR